MQLLVVCSDSVNQQMLEILFGKLLVSTNTVLHCFYGLLRATRTCITCVASKMCREATIESIPYLHRKEALFKAYTRLRVLFWSQAYTGS